MEEEEEEEAECGLDPMFFAFLCVAEWDVWFVECFGVSVSVTPVEPLKGTYSHYCKVCREGVGSDRCLCDNLC